MACCVGVTNVKMTLMQDFTSVNLVTTVLMDGTYHLHQRDINVIRMTDEEHITLVSRMQLLRTAWHVRRRKRRQWRFGKAALSPHFLILSEVIGSLQEFHQIDTLILYFLGECYNHRSLNQWPPVGKSSDTPKE